MSRAILILPLLLGACAKGNTPDIADAPPPPICETGAAYHQFDFWIGEWNVTNQASGQHAGTNEIRKEEYGCMLQEYWTSATGGTGSSINYYNPLTAEWRQVWISNGYTIDISGGLDDEGAMALVGTIYYYRPSTSFRFKGTWTPNKNGSVRQHFEQYDPDSETWTQWFDGLYEKIE